MVGVKLFLLFTFAHTTVQQRPEPSEPSGYVQGTPTSNYYYFSTDEEKTKNYPVAARRCRENGGHLAVINDQAELDFLKTKATRLITSDSQKYSYFIGYAGASWVTAQHAVAEAYYSNHTFANIDSDTSNSMSTLATDWQNSEHPQARLKYVPSALDSDQFLPATADTTISNPYGYICEREVDTCSCAKMNEPVIRTFDGLAVQLDAFCQYTLLDLKSVKVEIRTRPAEIAPQFPYDPTDYPLLGVFIDEIRITNRDNKKIYIMTNPLRPGEGNSLYRFSFDGTPENVGEAPDIYFDARGGAIFKDPDVTAEVSDMLFVDTAGGAAGGGSLNPFLLKHKVGPTGELRVVFDGVNVELILDYNTANNGPVKGLCGTCNDEKKLIGGDGVQTTSSYAYGYSWISEKGQCPASMYRPAACVSDLMYRKAVERCQGLVDIKHGFNIQSKGCISKFVLKDLRDRENLFTACVSSTCEFGPMASCHYYRKALWYCGYSTVGQDSFFTDQEIFNQVKDLDCAPDKLCADIDIENTKYKDSEQFNGTCYRLIKDDEPPYSAYTAERKCQESFGHLASIHSKDEKAHIVDTFTQGDGAPKPDINDPDGNLFWIGHVVGMTSVYNAFNKEANLDGSRVDFQLSDLTTPGSPDYNNGPCVSVTNNPADQWKMKSCSDKVPGILCSYKSYVPCGEEACFHPQKCDQTTKTCYDPCFDQGFYSEGHCYSMFPLPYTPDSKPGQNRPSHLPPLLQ